MDIKSMTDEELANKAREAMAEMVACCNELRRREWSVALMPERYTREAADLYLSFNETELKITVKKVITDTKNI